MTKQNSDTLDQIIAPSAAAYIRVRRSSDNAEMNIGFMAKGGLDTVALLAFVGSGNGIVSMYDQSSAP